MHQLVAPVATSVIAAYSSSTLMSSLWPVPTVGSLWEIISCVWSVHLATGGGTEGCLYLYLLHCTDSESGCYRWRQCSRRNKSLVCNLISFLFTTYAYVFRLVSPLLLHLQLRTLHVEMVCRWIFRSMYKNPCSLECIHSKEQAPRGSAKKPAMKRTASKRDQFQQYRKAPLRTFRSFYRNILGLMKRELNEL